MINRDMRYYDYLKYSGSSGYGMDQLTEDVQGSVKMAIYHSSTSVQDNIKYSDCTYTALTNDSSIDDTFVIKYGKEKLKVMYIIPAGRYKQVYLKEI
jgi:hypothetical protein